VGGIFLIDNSSTFEKVYHDFEMDKGCVNRPSNSKICSANLLNLKLSFARFFGLLKEISAVGGSLPTICLVLRAD